MTEKEKKILDYYDKIQDLKGSISEINTEYYNDIGAFIKWLSKEYNATEKLKAVWGKFKNAYEYRKSGKCIKIHLESKINDILNMLKEITKVDYSIYILSLKDKIFKDKIDEDRNITEPDKRYISGAPRNNR